MKSVLFITNIKVPYRVEFFNQLAKECNLTVLYERDSSDNRDSKWTNSNRENYKKIFLNGFKTGNENSFSIRILKQLFGQFDVIIIGCYNSPVQMFAMIMMRLLKRGFVISTDGELFIGDSGLKNAIKRFFLKGAVAYLTAGEKSAETLRRAIGDKRIIPYYFSSLTKAEVELNAKKSEKREDYILVVGQYYPYKGMDIAVEVAKKMPNQRFKFVGMGKRTELFIEECGTNELKNVEIIPFLQKEQLYTEYKKCKGLLLPSRQECWGLVVNEAASFGTPIISTYGSGAAVEFFEGCYNDFIVEPNSVDAMINALHTLSRIDSSSYSRYLIEKSKMYTIENAVSVIRILIDNLGQS